jgi:signal recognition particle subunit SRP54
VGITGIVLTRVDGDGRGGAALSMRAVTGKPIKLIGVGEKWDALEDFHPERIAGRILGMGDVVSLVEKAAQNIDVEKAQAIAQKLKKGEFDLEDLSDQLKQMEKLGGMSGMMGLLPGVAKVKKQLESANIDDKIIKRQRAIISSMTPKERRFPKILDGKRKRRIAAGSGTKVEEVNRLLKMHRQMADMMKMMGKRGGLMSRMMGMGGGGGGPSAADVERMQAELAALDPKALQSLPAELKGLLPPEGAAPAAAQKQATKGLPGLPGLPGGAAPKMPGLPGLGGAPFRGFPGFPGKKK